MSTRRTIKHESYQIFRVKNLAESEINRTKQRTEKEIILQRARLLTENGGDCERSKKFSGNTKHYAIMKQAQSIKSIESTMF